MAAITLLLASCPPLAPPAPRALRTSEAARLPWSPHGCPPRSVHPRHSLAATAACAAVPPPFPRRCLAEVSSPRGSLEEHVLGRRLAPPPPPPPHPPSPPPHPPRSGRGGSRRRDRELPRAPPWEPGPAPRPAPSAPSAPNCPCALPMLPRQPQAAMPPLPRRPLSPWWPGMEGSTDIPEFPKACCKAPGGWTRGLTRQ